MARDCPKCQRPNNDRALRCFYCGTLFPEAAASPRPAPDKTADPAPAPARRPFESYQVVIAPRQELAAEELTALAAELGLDDYTARHKLRSPAPWIARAYPDSEQAQALLTRINALELSAYVVKQSGVDKIKDFVQVTQIKTIGDGRIVFMTIGGQEAELVFAELNLIVRGRIQERPERQEDLEDERPAVNLGKMVYGPDDNPKEKGMVRGAVERFSFRPRPARMRWVLFAGAGNETMDLYHGKVHQPLRMIETEFDYTGLGGQMKPSSLHNFNTIFKLLLERAPSARVDSTFNTVGYTFNEEPEADKVRSELTAMLGVSESSRKMFDNRVAFTEHSARSYLHFLHERSHPGSPAAPAPPVQGLKFKPRYDDLGPWLVPLCALLIFVRPVIALFTMALESAPLRELYSHPALIGLTLADLLFNAGVAVFGVVVGLQLLYLNPKAVANTKTFLVLYFFFHACHLVLPLVQARVASSAELAAAGVTGAGGWDAALLLAALALSAGYFYYLTVSELVKRTYRQ